MACYSRSCYALQHREPKSQCDSPWSSQESPGLSCERDGCERSDHLELERECFFEHLLPTEKKGADENNSRGREENLLPTFYSLAIGN